MMTNRFKWMCIRVYSQAGRQTNLKIEHVEIKQLPEYQDLITQQRHDLWDLRDQLSENNS
jgi:hypothetical protein